MARRNVRGIMFAMEDMETGEIANNGGELEAGVAEINEDAGDLSGGADVVEDTLDTVEPLEGIAEVMDKAADNGGLSPDAAEIADIAVEALCARLGFDQPKCIYSLEAFGSKSSREAATRIATEEVWAKIKDTYNKIVAWIKEQVEKLIVFFKKMTTVGPLLERSLKSTKAKIDALPEKANPKKGVGGFEDAGIAKAILVGEDKGSTDTYKALSNRMAVAKEALKLGDKYEVDFEGKQGVSASKVMAPIANSKTFIGGKKLVITEASGFTEGKDFKPATINFEDTEVNENAKTCNIMNKAQLKEAIKIALEIVEETNGFIKNEGKLRKAKDTAIKNLNDAIGKEDAKDEDKKSNRAKIQDIGNAFTSFQRLMFNIPTLSVKTAKVANAYCQKSLDNYETPKD